jgi:hypothetical protein
MTRPRTSKEVGQEGGFLGTWANGLAEQRKATLRRVEREVDEAEEMVSNVGQCYRRQGLTLSRSRKWRSKYKECLSRFGHPTKPD